MLRKGGAIMKGKIVTLVLLFLASLLFPYTMTILCFDTGLMSYQPEDLYCVVLENEETVSAEQYLVGILAQEIDPSMEQEKLKAQAILARTWLYRAIGTKTSVSESELAIHAMTLSQMKSVWGEDEYLYYEKLHAAVVETAGQCLYYGNELAAPLFHKISAGMTRFDQTGSCPYLVGVDCVYDAESPGYQTVKQFTREEFAGQLNKIDETRQLAAPVNAADVALTLDAQGYVMNLQVSGVSFSAEEAALALGIPSLWFRLEDYADTIRVIAKGIGHGYGMSQYGADRYAGEGRDYKWILQHYFQVCEVKDNSSR